ncbi:tRNA-uridine aminocarboxypropyltransferase 1-like isoform X1 [Oscarella lobularis]|uniref:tRNA-uridine aminocarboxypropyltransferase 1-like isoform X1 n=1 Tax=Oscarella lobularis TaxID=121494 RepID=UPI0033130C5D
MNDDLRDSPFHDFFIDSFAPLKRAARDLCPKCRSSRKFFCYTCLNLVGLAPSTVPHVRLPWKVHIVKHEAERPGKSTAPHACILAPDSVQIHMYPDMPPCLLEKEVLLVYPSDDAVPLAALADSITTYDQVVFIDSTWSQAKSIVKDQRLEGIRRVRLSKAKTNFWRVQSKPNTFLATIEAIYYFFKELHEVKEKGVPYDGRYDNLLYFFAYQYMLIQQKRKATATTADPPTKTCDGAVE